MITGCVGFACLFITLVVSKYKQRFLEYKHIYTFQVKYCFISGCNPLYVIQPMTAVLAYTPRWPKHHCGLHNGPHKRNSP